MIQSLLTLSILMMISFSMVSHPLSMGLILLIQTTLISMITGIMSPNFWFSYILFMIMIGGMLVLFIYMTSIASNEKFNFSLSIKSTLIISLMTIMLLMMMDQLISYLSLLNIDTMETLNEKSFKLSISKYYNFPSNMIMVTMIIYLLIALIAVVKITNIKYGPLRKKM